MTDIGTLDANRVIPKDLEIKAQPDTDKNFFRITITNLKIDETYAAQFQYVYKDNIVSDWSPGFIFNTQTETVPSAPTSTVEGGAGFIKVSLPTFPANALRVDVRISGGIFGDGTKVSDSFTAAGTKTIAAPGGASPGFAYVVTLLTVTPSKINGDPSSPVTVYVTDPSATLAITSPEDPFAPTVRAGLASVIVEWSGKKSDGTDLVTTGFYGAKVHIGTTSGFTPNSDNWVHTLNFANGSNRVSIGVGSVIDKTAGTTLQYGTPYFIKLVSTNANGQLSNAVSASNNPVTVAKLPASEISTGILTADASVTAGVSGGQRVVISGSSAPFIIYGTDGTTKLLEYVTAGTTGSLAIKGSGEFTGSLSIGTSPNIFKAQPATGIWLGADAYASAPFKVNTTGYLESTSGKIGGWNITGSILESSTVSNNKITLNPATPKIALVQSGTERITFDPVEGIVGPNITYGGVSVPSFKLTPSGNLTLYGSITVTGGNAATTDSVTAVSNAVSSKNKTFYQNDAPTNPISGYTLVAGDLWFDTDDNNKPYRWNGTWQNIQDGTIAAAKAKADTSLQQGGNEIRNASNQITSISSTGITITGSTFSLNGAGTATSPSANSLVINSSGITAQNSSGQNTFFINASTGDAEFRGTIKSGSTISGAEITTLNDASTYGYLKLNSQGSVLQLLGNDNTVYGELYQYNNGNEIILRHGNSRPFGYPYAGNSPTGLGAMLSLNPYTITLQFVNATGVSSFGLDISSNGDNMFTGTVNSNSSGGANSVGNTLRYFRNTIITNTTPSGSGFAIGDIWIQY